MQSNRKGGYGLVYQDVMRNRNISPESKAIYAYLSSFAGNGTTCYPTLQLMCKELHMTTNRFSKYMNELVSMGVVEKKRERNGGLFGRNIYIITHEVKIVEVENQSLQNEDTQNNCFRLLENSVLEDLVLEDSANNSNSNKSNSIKNNNIKANVRSEPDKSASSPSVISLPLNDKTMYEVTREDYDKWVSLYPAVDVMQELRNMYGWLDSNPAKRKTRRGIKSFITRWLGREQDKGGSRTSKAAEPEEFESRIKPVSQYENIPPMYEGEEDIFS